MLSQSVNKPRAVATAGVTSATITLTAIPPAATFAATAAASGFFDWENAPLTINDAASLAAAGAGNQLAAIPYSALLTLGVGGTIAVGSTSNGLTVSQVPPGCAISVSTSP
jgi:hypothetical protein